MSSPLRRARGRSRLYRQWRRDQGRGRVPYGVPLARVEVDPGPEVECVYWHPQRFGVEFAPDDIQDKLREIHPSLSACRPPARAPVPRRRWLIWSQEAVARTNPFSPGWYLVFVWQHPVTGGYLPLEPFEPIGYNLYRVMRTKNGGAAVYFDKMQAALRRSKQRREATYTADRQTRQREMLAHRRISNIGTGSKFALHHDGTIVPSRNEANWLRETALSRMPQAVRDRIAAEQDDLRSKGVIP